MDSTVRLCRDIEIGTKKKVSRFLHSVSYPCNGKDRCETSTISCDTVFSESVLLTVYTTQFRSEVTP